MRDQTHTADLCYLKSGVNICPNKRFSDTLQISHSIGILINTEPCLRSDTSQSSTQCKQSRRPYVSNIFPQLKNENKLGRITPLILTNTHPGLKSDSSPSSRQWKQFRRPDVSNIFPPLKNKNKLKEYTPLIWTNTHPCLESDSSPSSTQWKQSHRPDVSNVFPQWNTRLSLVPGPLRYQGFAFLNLACQHWFSL